MKWRLDFVSDKHPDNADDQRLVELIKRDARKYEYSEIDDMVEFDIRKNFASRCWFWLLNRTKHGISFNRYAKCVLKAVKHKLL